MARLISDYPGRDWERIAPDADVDLAEVAASLDALGNLPADAGISLATLAVHRGRIVAERYGPTAAPDETLISWSMAKSVVHALVGILVRDGLIDVSAPPPMAAWRGDERREITIQQLLDMRSGLQWAEDYVDAEVSDVIEMLFGSGQHDVAGYAAALPLVHPPNSSWCYSSGTTNIVARIVGDVVGGGEAGMRAFMSSELFEPIGMVSADPRFDDTGTFIGSSFLYCTAADFARFGYLYLHDGVWDGRRILPAGWVDHARTSSDVPASEPFGYGAHWWLWPDWPRAFGAHGFEGQRILVVPDRQLVVVQLSKNPDPHREHVDVALRRLVNAFPPAEEHETANGH